jgi:hypothetical protein
MRENPAAPSATHIEFALPEDRLQQLLTQNRLEQSELVTQTPRGPLRLYIADVNANVQVPIAPGTDRQPFQAAMGSGTAYQIIIETPNRDRDWKDRPRIFLPGSMAMQRKEKPFLGAMPAMDVGDQYSVHFDDKSWQPFNVPKSRPPTSALVSGINGTVPADTLRKPIRVIVFHGFLLMDQGPVVDTDATHARLVQAVGHFAHLNLPTVKARPSAPVIDEVQPIAAFEIHLRNPEGTELHA